MRAHAGPERLGRYVLGEKLGEGGMGVVYLAEDPDGRSVAIKVLRQGVPGETTARRRLAREVDTMRLVRSPYVAEVLDADVAGDPPYIVTQYVAGPTLENVVGSEGPLRGADLARLATGLAAALVAVHGASVVHRDLKPGNVMMVDGEPVVIDFGIAQAPDATRLTMTGMFMGTPGYLAPEVIDGRGSGPASDVHSWGATVAYAATGRPPFGTGQFETIFYRIVHGQPDLDGLPAPLLSLVLRALSRDPARRPSAPQLHELTSRLDPGALVPGPAAASVSASALVGAAGSGAGTAVLGGAGGQTTGTPSAPTVQDCAPQDYSAPAGLSGVPTRNGDSPGWAGTRPLAAPGKDDFADLLTPVRYAQPPAGNGSQAAAQADVPAAPARQAPPGPGPGGPVTGHGAAGQQTSATRLAVLATMIVLIAVSVLRPVAGTVAALAVLVALRGADLTAGWLGRRRQRQGPRGADVVSGVALYPLALIRSALRFIGVAPLALLCAVAAAVLAVLAGGSASLPRAGAVAAGALVACYGLGPGSVGCRRPLGGFYASLSRSTLAAMAGGIGLAAITVVLVAGAVRFAPGYWPAVHLGNELKTTNLQHGVLSRIPSDIGTSGSNLFHWLARRL
jgi:Protein kinase domain